MTNQVATIDMSNFGPLAPSMRAVVAAMPTNESEFSTGVTGGFAVVSIKGKLWRIKYQGNEQVLMRSANEPMQSVELVLVRASAAISKIYYESAYTSDSDAPPDCWSANGVTPAAEAPKKQSATCASCPKGAWGSKITDQGKKAKACSDSRRMAVVPLGDITNDMYGGPMLLRVPPASLGELAAFDAKMRQMGYPLFSIGVRVGFDINSEYQKLVYSAIRPLTEDEAKRVLALREDPQVLRILDADDVTADAAPAATPASVFEQPPAPAPAPAPVQQVATPKPAAKPKAVPQAAAAPTNGFGGFNTPSAQPAAAPVQAAAVPAAGGFGGFAAAPAPAAAAPAPEPQPQVAAVPATDDLDSLLDDLLPS